MSIILAFECPLFFIQNYMNTLVSFRVKDEKQRFFFNQNQVWQIF